MAILDILGSLGNEYGRNVGVNRQLRAELAKQQIAEREMSLRERTEKAIEDERSQTAKHLQSSVKLLSDPQRTKSGSYVALVQDGQGNVTWKEFPLPPNQTMESAGTVKGRDIRDELTEELGRSPTDAEVERRLKMQSVTQGRGTYLKLADPDSWTGYSMVQVDPYTNRVMGKQLGATPPSTAQGSETTTSGSFERVEVDDPDNPGVKQVWDVPRATSTVRNPIKAGPGRPAPPMTPGSSPARPVAATAHGGMPAATALPSPFAGAAPTALPGVTGARAVAARPGAPAVAPPVRTAKGKPAPPAMPPGSRLLGSVTKATGGTANVKKAQQLKAESEVGLHVLDVALFGDTKTGQPGLFDTMSVLNSTKSRIKLSMFTDLMGINKPETFIDKLTPQSLDAIAHSLGIEALTDDEAHYLFQVQRAASAIQGLRSVTGLPRSTQALMNQYILELPTPSGVRSNPQTVMVRGKPVVTNADGLYKLRAIRREILTALNNGIKAVAEGRADADTNQPPPSQQQPQSSGGGVDTSIRVLNVEPPQR